MTPTEQWDREYRKFIDTVSLYPKGYGTVKADNQEDIFIYIDEMYLVPGIVGEVGELASIYAKAVRDNHGDIDDEDRRTAIIKELGDILWFIDRFAKLFGLTLQELAELNMEKLKARKARGTLQGSGDNR